MKKKIWSILLILALAVTMLSACKKTSGVPDGVVEDEDSTEEEISEDEAIEYVFGYTCIDMENPYFESLQLSLQTAVEDAGARLVTYNAEGTIEKQLEQINQMIADGVDAVFLCPVDWKEIQPGIDALNEADIPIINVDTQVKDLEHVDAYIGSDNENAGFVCGQNLLSRKPEGGRIVVLECQTMNSINERITGFEESIAKSGFEVIARVNAEGDKAKARDEISRLLAENAQIDAIMCGNDQMALGAMEAVKTAERTDIIIYGVDGSPEVKAQIASGSSPIVGTGAQSPINIGKAAAKTVFAILNDEDYEKMTYEETFFIDHTNVELYGTDGWQ